MDKNKIDQDAEREAAAMKKVGNERMPNRRVRLAEDYNRERFDRLFSRRSSQQPKSFTKAFLADTLSKPYKGR